MRWTIVRRSTVGLIVSNGAQQYDVPLDSKYISQLNSIWVDKNCIGKSFNCDTSNAKEALDAEVGAQKLFNITKVFLGGLNVLFFGGVIVAIYFAYRYFIKPILIDIFFKSLWDHVLGPIAHVLGLIWSVSLVGKCVVVIVLFLAVIFLAGIFGHRREDYGPRNSP